MHENHEHDANETAMHDAYQCPMDCEDGKTYEKEGTCPVCNMNLKKVEKQQIVIIKQHQYYLHHN